MTTTRRLGLVVHRPALTLLGVLIATLPIQVYVNPMGLPIFVGYPMILVIGGFVLARGRFGGRWRIGPIIILFYVSILLSMTQVSQYQEAFIRLGHFTFGFLILVLTAGLVERHDDVQFLISAFLWPALAVAVIGVGLWFTTNVLRDRGVLDLVYVGALAPSFYGSRTADLFRSAFEANGSYYSLQKGTTEAFLGQVASVGLFGLPALNASYSAVLLFAGLLLSRGWTALRVATQVLLSLNLLLSQSRTIWAAAIAALIALWVLSGPRALRFRVRLRRYQLVLVLLAGVAAVVPLVVFIGLENLMLQLLSPVRAILDPAADAGTTESRLVELSQGLQYFLSAPLTGIGVDKGPGGLLTHNEFLNMAALLGIFGLIAYCALLIVPFALASQLASSARADRARRFSRIYQVLIVFWAVEAIGSSRFSNPKTLLLFGFLTGLLIACANLECVRDRRPDLAATEAIAKARPN